MELTQRQIDNFWAKVNKNGPIHPYDSDLGNCWDWTGAGSRRVVGKREDSYGMVRINKRCHRATGISFFLANGFWPIPFCLHSCDRPKCVNPAHLRAGTPKENAADAIARKRFASGDNHGTRLHPECRARGESHRAVMREHAARGDSHVCAKVTAEDVREMRRIYAAGGVRHIDLAKKYGLKRSSIGLILSGKNWKHVKREDSLLAVAVKQSGAVANQTH